MMIDESWYERPSGVRNRVSAGGVVVRVDRGQVYVALVGEISLPYRVLPKGGVEPGEKVEETARREIGEEAGINSLELIQKLGIRERLSYDRTRWNTTHYFLFVTEQVEGSPTDDEHHFAFAWHSIDALPMMFWPEQRELIETHREKIIGFFRQDDP